MKNIPCIKCKYCVLDPTASLKDWQGFQCANPKSEYHKALLNVGINGEMHDVVSWRGCPEGIKKSGCK